MSERTGTYRKGYNCKKKSKNEPVCEPQSDEESEEEECERKEVDDHEHCEELQQVKKGCEEIPSYKKCGTNLNRKIFPKIGSRYKSGNDNSMFFDGSDSVLYTGVCNALGLKNVPLYRECPQKGKDGSIDVVMFIDYNESLDNIKDDLKFVLHSDVLLAYYVATLCRGKGGLFKVDEYKLKVDDLAKKAASFSFIVGQIKLSKVKNTLGFGLCASMNGLKSHDLALYDRTMSPAPVGGMYIKPYSDGESAEYNSDVTPSAYRDCIRDHVLTKPETLKNEMSMIAHDKSYVLSTQGLIHSLLLDNSKSIGYEPEKFITGTNNVKITELTGEWLKKLIKQKKSDLEKNDIIHRELTITVHPHIFGDNKWDTVKKRFLKSTTNIVPYTKNANLLDEIDHPHHFSFKLNINLIPAE